MPDFSISIVPKTGGGAEFDPNSLPAPQLAGISWNNTTGIPHQIRIPSQNFETQPILPGQGSKPLYIVKGNDEDTIPYSCALHPDEVGSIFISPVVDLNAGE